ncbi:MAG: Ig-like domain-containing protein [Bacteroidales bacterium]|nr:Ig-like domain-containing protein [Bacteroidales bacterium]
MKFNKNTIYQLLTVILLAVYCLNTTSCANTQGAPTGGLKDTLPPVVLSAMPPAGSTNIPLEKTKIEITFNEFIEVKEAFKNVFLSPPQSKAPKTKIKGKTLVVSFEEPLDSNTSYSLIFGDAIRDFNEGNILYNYVYSFSTGNTLDSMILSGSVMDYQKLQPQEGITVLLYKDATDSTVVNELPDAIAKTDKWGYFTVRNLKDVPYHVFAIKDENNNNKYDLGIEDVGFVSKTIVPKVLYNDSLPQISTYDMTDTTACLARPCEVHIYTFREKSNIQYIKESQRPTVRGAYLKFNAENAVIDSFSIRGIRRDRLITQFNRVKDSLNFWIKGNPQPEDTLNLGIKYLKSDSTGKLVPQVEKIRLTLPRAKQQPKGKSKIATRQTNQREDLLKFNIEASPEKVEQYGIVFTFNEPLEKALFDSLRFTLTTPRKITSNVEYTVEQDSFNINRYIVRPKEQFKVGNDYEIVVPHANFKDINGFTNDSTNVKITLPTDDNLSSIQMILQNVDNKYIIELISENRATVFRDYTISKDTSLLFPYLKEGKYSIRITQDINNNGVLDPGNVIYRKEPEKVTLFTLPDGNSVIELGQKTDLEQILDIKEIFNSKHKDE